MSEKPRRLKYAEALQAGEQWVTIRRACLSIPASLAPNCSRAGRTRRCCDRGRADGREGSSGRFVPANGQSPRHPGPADGIGGGPKNSEAETVHSRRRATMARRGILSGASTASDSGLLAHRPPRPRSQPKTGSSRRVFALCGKRPRRLTTTAGLTDKVKQDEGHD